MCHVLIVHVDEALDVIFSEERAHESKDTSLQSLVHEINDFPKRSKVRFVKGAKNGHDDVLIPWLPVVRKDGEYRYAVVPFIFPIL